MTYMIRGLSLDRFTPLIDLDAAGMLQTARLAGPGEVEAAIRDLFADETISYIDAHNAAHGCFAARIERDAAKGPMA